MLLDDDEDVVTTNQNENASPTLKENINQNIPDGQTMEMDIDNSSAGGKPTG